MTRNELNDSWKPDEVAECLEVSAVLAEKLWSIVCDNSNPSIATRMIEGYTLTEALEKESEEWPEYPRCTYEWTKHLSDAEFTSIIKAIEKDKQDTINWIERH